MKVMEVAPESVLKTHDRLKERFFISIILLLAMVLLVPPMFAEGRVFDVSAKYVNEVGKVVTEKAIYFDNVHCTAVYLLFSWLAISIPFLAGKLLHKSLQWISYMMGAWFVSNLIFEVANFAEPLEVYNSAEKQSLFNYFLITFILGTTFITIHAKWNKLEQS